MFVGSERLIYSSLHPEQMCYIINNGVAHRPVAPDCVDHGSVTATEINFSGYVRITFPAQ